jgi:O-antigen/teichoic acid export membrane protein
MNSSKDEAIQAQVLRGAVSNYLGKGVTLGTWFLLTPVILGSLGPTGYGLWALAGSVVAYGSLLDLGISRAVVKYVAEHRARGDLAAARQLVATALCLYTALGMFALGLAIALAAVFPALFALPPELAPSARWLVLLMGASVAIAIPASTAHGVLQGLQRYDVTSLLSAATTLLSATGTVGALLLGGDVVAMVAVNIPVTLLMQIPYVWWVYRLAPELRFGWRGARRGLARTILGFSGALFVADAAARLQTKSDELVVGALLSVAAVTPYTIARKLGELAQLLTDQFLRVLLPVASTLHAEQDAARLRALYLTGTRLTLLIFTPTALTLAILGPRILAAWVGEAYAAYGPLVAVLTLAGLLSTSQWPGISILQGMARHRFLAGVALITGVANLALSIALAPALGLMGVALGTLIPATTEALLVICPFVLRTLGVRAGELLRAALLPALPLALVLFSLGERLARGHLPELIVTAAAGLVVYLAGCLAIGAETPEQRMARRALGSVLRTVRTRLRRP